MRRKSLVFNELSISKDFKTDLCTTKEEAHGLMYRLIAILQAADKLGIRYLRTQKDFLSYWLSPNFSVREWMLDTEGHYINYEAQEFFSQSIELLSPFDVDLADNHPIKYRIAEGFITDYDEIEAIGLGYAFLFKEVAVSLYREKWDLSILHIRRLEEAGEGVEQVRHASDISHFSIHHPSRTYEGNPKHPSAGEEQYIAIMDLTNSEATNALIQGVHVDGLNEIYCYYNESFYVFRHHLEGVYHGYKVRNFHQSNRKKILQAMRDEELINEKIYREFIS